MRRGGFAYVSVLLGIMLASLLALTTDQIIQKVYDSGNTAFRVNVVAGGGGAGSPGGANTDVQFNDSTAFGGTAGLTFVKATNVLSIGVSPAISSLVPAADGLENDFNGVYVDKFFVGTTGVTQSGLDISSQSGGGDIGLAANSSDGTGTTLLNIASTSTVFDFSNSATGGLILGSSLGPVRIATGGTVLAAEMWDFAVDGNLVALNGGGVMPKAAAIASAPTCDSSHKGMLATATDCNAGCTQGGTCTTGGAIVCPIYCDGSAWKEH